MHRQVRNVARSASKQAWVLGLTVLMALSAASCSSDASATWDPTARKAAAHLASSTGVHFAGGSCRQKTSAPTTCRLQTKSDRDVVVKLVTIGGHQYFETVSGLLDGHSLGVRLASDLSRELHKTVHADCGKVITANIDDTADCHVDVPGSPERKVKLRILDDHTGDYTIVVPAHPAHRVSTTTSEAQR